MRVSALWHVLWHEGQLLIGFVLAVGAISGWAALRHARQQADPDAHLLELAPDVGRQVALAVAVAMVVAWTLLPRSFLMNNQAGVNLVPLESIRASLLSPHAARNVLGNLLLFAPLGAALAIRRPGRAFRSIMVGSLALATGVEVLQLALPRRAVDVDDVLINVTGAACGAAIVITVKQLLSSSMPAET